MTNKAFELYHGDSLEILKNLKAQGVLVDSVITDPPYGIRFMNRKWDYDVPSVEFWQLVFDVLKPGGHLLSFGGTRTYHRLVVNIEDAGFEIRDQICWLYGTGFPKSLNVSREIAKIEGEALMEGWGTGLKPALEPIVLARKPFDTTVAQNVLENGTGALNVEACRIGSDTIQSINTAFLTYEGQNTRPWQEGHVNYKTEHVGRWPSNVIMDTESGELLETQSKGASRFFYCPKASKKERHGSKHPTVKPVALMRYLCKLVTPPGGKILDPYAGTGTTGEAALLEGFVPVMIEREAEYIADIEKRLAEVRSASEDRLADAWGDDD